MDSRACRRGAPPPRPPIKNILYPIHPLCVSAPSERQERPFSSHSQQRLHTPQTPQKLISCQDRRHRPTLSPSHQGARMGRRAPPLAELDVRRAFSETHAACPGALAGAKGGAAHPPTSAGSGEASAGGTSTGTSTSSCDVATIQTLVGWADQTRRRRSWCFLESGSGAPSGWTTPRSAAGPPHLQVRRALHRLWGGWGVTEASPHESPTYHYHPNPCCYPALTHHWTPLGPHSLLLPPPRAPAHPHRRCWSSSCSFKTSGAPTPRPPCR